MAYGAMTAPVRRLLMVQDDAEEAAVDYQSPGVAVIDEAKPAEFVHEVTDPRPGCTSHLCQVILTDSGKPEFGPAFLAGRYCGSRRGL